eukprot:CAMPEP_0171933612 /NCGR_PEP_ID=MMETSP0993-20121228/31388_1 /TAXON_ID=483369 /ORGANISM="non described non described, Strain CCMP2098" /LENGTH=525 /DNA_ID=CAMNT_0012574165 /DNA_START=53 /DNA_END=1626 /DNA_ORIENTATION=-
MACEESEEWFVFSESGCPIWSKQFDPVEQNEVPEPLEVLACGTSFRVRTNSLFDDSSAGELSRPTGAAAEAGEYPPVPLSTVRGRVGGYDDVSDAVVAARAIAAARSAASTLQTRSQTPAADQVGAGASAAPVDGQVQLSGPPPPPAAIGTLPSPPGLSFPRSTANWLRGLTEEKERLASGLGSDQQPSVSSLFSWLEVVAPRGGWVLDTAMVQAQDAHLGLTVTSSSSQSCRPRPRGGGGGSGGHESRRGGSTNTDTDTAAASEGVRPATSTTRHASGGGLDGSEDLDDTLRLLGLGDGNANGGGGDCAEEEEEEVGGDGARFVAGPVLVRKGNVAEATSRWVYRVVCADGALVRKGLELSSPHRCTLKPHSLLEVSERRINDQGLARLRTADGRGWVSEQLNPLSGHRGPIVSLVALPLVLRFRVTLPEGALVRSTCELSSAPVRTIEAGQPVEIVAKNFSDHPQNRCIPRLALADGTGWVSQRLNREPPFDKPVLEIEFLFFGSSSAKKATVGGVESAGGGG